jgi:hypothetical protein
MTAESAVAVDTPGDHMELTAICAGRRANPGAIDRDLDVIRRRHGRPSRALHSYSSGSIARFSMRRPISSVHHRTLPLEMSARSQRK